jgi:RNA polymerase sigma-70 factor, ECF subfamily
MTAAAQHAGYLVGHDVASTFGHYGRVMSPGFLVPRKPASDEKGAEAAVSGPAPARDLTGTEAELAESGARPAAAAANSQTSAAARLQPAAAAQPVADVALQDAMLRYAQGDNAAFPDVYAQLAPRLHGFCARLCAGGAEADDLLQETLLKLHRSRSAYRQDANPLHWAFAIARCAYIDRLRRRKVRPEVLGTSASAVASKVAGSEPESELRAAQLQALVQSVLLAQPEAARTSYILVRLEGVSVADAAAILSASSDAIKQRVHRVAQALREQLHRRGLDVQP